MFVAKRASAASSGRPITSQKRANCGLLPTVITIGPSAASNTPYGTIDGCALP